MIWMLCFATQTVMALVSMLRPPWKSSRAMIINRDTPACEDTLMIFPAFLAISVAPAPRNQEGAQIDRHCRVPIPMGAVSRGARRATTGVVDENIDGAEFLQRGPSPQSPAPRNLRDPLQWQSIGPKLFTAAQFPRALPCRARLPRCLPGIGQNIACSKPMPFVGAVTSAVLPKG